MGFVLCTSLSVVKSLNCCSPLARIFWTVAADTSSTISLVSKAKRHSPSSSNGFPASSNAETRASTSLVKAFCTDGICSWWSFSLSCESKSSCSKLLTKHAISGPAVTHLIKSAGLLVKSQSTSITFHCCIALFMCMIKSCCRERTFALFTVKAPQQKAWKLDGWCTLNLEKSLRYTESQRA